MIPAMTDPTGGAITSHIMGWRYQALDNALTCTLTPEKENLGRREEPRPADHCETRPVHGLRQNAEIMAAMFLPRRNPHPHHHGLDILRVHMLGGSVAVYRGIGQPQGGQPELVPR
jgi:hypothetical protein